ncbi:MAG TPA: IclR family transcriptional regulator [Candidatus Dormibacteraeota bacterium]
MRAVSSVSRACGIIGLVSQSPEPLRISAIAKRLDIPRNTTYELVNTLCAEKCLELGAGSTVRLGFRLFEFGSAYAQSLDLIREARQAAREVVMDCNETCHVARLEGREVVYLVKEEGNQVVRMSSVVGRRLPAHGTAVGKAMLANLPRHELTKLLSGARLERLTANTITDLDELIQELDRTIARRYSVDNEESTPGVRCVGAPIRDVDDHVVAALSISVPAARMGSRRERELGTLVMETADNLSKRLGHSSRSAEALGT